MIYVIVYNKYTFGISCNSSYCNSNYQLKVNLFSLEVRLAVKLHSVSFYTSLEVFSQDSLLD